MCEIFIGADPRSYVSHTRSVRLHGAVTSIRLEQLFWMVLDEIAERDGMKLAQLLEKLYDELIEARGEVGNFASFLRVCALRYEALLAHGGLPVDLRVPIRTVEPRQALSALPVEWNAPIQPPPLSSSARFCADEKSSAPL